MVKAASDGLYKFNHQGGEAVICQALADYGARYADGNDYLRSLVSNLYKSLQWMRTQTSRDFLVQRLFEERHSYWCLGSALAALSSTDILDRAIAQLRQRNELAAAAAIREHCHHDGRLVELAKEMLGWPTPQDNRERSLFAYVMLEACRSAITVRNFKLVKETWARASNLGEPFSPYHTIGRGNDYKSPIGEGALKEEGWRPM